MAVEETPDDDLRDPLTPVDLLLPGAWRTPRPDRRSARRPEDRLPLAPPPRVVRSPSTPPTLPLPLGDLADVAPAPPGPPPPPQAPAVPAAIPAALPAALPPLPEWSDAAQPRAVGSRSVLGAAAGLVVVGGVSLWLGLLPIGGSGGAAQPAASSAAARVVPASEPSPQAPATTTRPTTTKTPAATRTSTAPRTSTTTRRSSTAPAAGTVLVDPGLYVGRPARQAQRALRRLGLKVEVQLVTTGARRQTAGVVVAVRPSGRVPAGSTVLLVVRA